MSVASLIGFGRVFGSHPIGFGDPFASPWRGVADPPGGVVPDDGGVRVTVAGDFKAGARHEVWVSVGSDWRRCYSGVSGQGWGVVPAADGSVTFVVPGGLALGPHNVRVKWPGGMTEVTGALVVVRRNRRAKSYEMARYFPPRFAAGRGRSDVSQETLLEWAADVATAPLYGPLRAVKEAIADMGNRAGGLILTRLLRDLPPAPFGVSPPAEALEALVETTHEFPAAGTIACRGELVNYTAAADGTISGLVRNDAVRETYPRGEPVALWTRDVSDRDLARRALLVDTAEGPFLDVLGSNYGVPRFLDCGDDTYRRLIRALAYQVGKGTRTAIEETLSVLFDDSGPAAADGVVSRADRTLTSAAGLFTPGMLDLRVRLRGTGRNTDRIVRIDRVIDASTVRFDPRDGPGWQPADLDDEIDTVWSVVPYNVLETPYKPCTVIIQIAGAPPTDATGFGYLQGGEAGTVIDTSTVAVSSEIRQVLGVWLASDTQRQGTNYATSNLFEGVLIALDTPLPSADVAVVVDYGSVVAPAGGLDTGVPGRADGGGTAQLLPDVNTLNTGDPAYFPLYLGDRSGALQAIFDALTVAGVVPELDVRTW